MSSLVNGVLTIAWLIKPFIYRLDAKNEYMEFEFQNGLFNICVHKNELITYDYFEHIKGERV